MADTSTAGGSHPGQRTFDCPWCGAISSIPTDHMGEHFTCPECKKGTKLTKKNTSSRKPTAPPPDAPHLSGDRTFDCPWCGRISSISAAYVGEQFKCPECLRETKITETNTTRASVTAVPPDAPHAAGAGAGRRAAVTVLVLAVAGVAVWMSMAGEKQKTPKEAANAPAGGAPGAATEPEKPASPESTTPPGPAAAPTPTAAPGAVPPAVAPPGETAPTPSAAPATSPKEEAPALVAARKALADATARATEAEKRVKAAREKRSAWAAKNPNSKDAPAALATLRALTAEAERMRGGLDPAKTTPDQVRNYNLAVVSYVSSDPKRARLMETVLAWLRYDLHGREALGMAWTSINFHGPGFDRAVKAMDARLAGAPAEPPALAQEETDAQDALVQANQAVEDAAKAVQKLEAPQ